MLLPNSSPRFGAKTNISQCFLSAIPKNITWKHRHFVLHNECPLWKVSAPLACTEDAQNRHIVTVKKIILKRGWRIFYFLIFFPWASLKIKYKAKMKILFKLFSQAYFLSFEVWNESSNLLIFFRSRNGKFIFQIRFFKNTADQKSSTMYLDKRAFMKGWA